MSPSTGYLYDHPLAVASQTSDRHWPMGLLMEGKPFQAVPDEWWDPHLPPAALDQGAVGACVAFAGETIKSGHEHADWGAWLFDSASAFKAYDWLKHGHGTFPGDGIPNVEGSWPEALWQLARMEGLPDKAGKVHRITAYYDNPLASDADWAFVQQVMLTYGSVNVATPWPGNWFNAPSGPDYLQPAPGAATSGHSYTVGGWKRIGGIWHIGCMNSWGTWGSAQGRFYFPVSWLFSFPLGPQIVWKTIDQKDAPFPPPPEPGGPMLIRIDKTPRLVDSALGKTLYAADGVTVVTTLQSGAVGLNSPSAYGSIAGGPITYYAVEITFRGIPQLAWLKRADCTNVRPVATDPAAIEAARKAGEATGAKAVKEAAIAEAILHGG